MPTPDTGPAPSHGIRTAHEFLKGNDDRFYEEWTDTQQALAEQRRAERPDLQTWGPFDQAEPDPAPEAVADIDRDLWVHDAASRRWHLRYSEHGAAAGRARPAKWDMLVLENGPVTAAPPELLALLPAPKKRRKGKALPAIDPVLKLRLPEPGVPVVDAMFRRWFPADDGRYRSMHAEEVVTPEALAAETGPLRVLGFGEPDDEQALIAPVAAAGPAALLVAARALQNTATRLEGILPVDQETAMRAGRKGSWESGRLGELVWAPRVNTEGHTVPAVMVDVLFRWVTGGPDRTRPYVELAENLADLWAPAFDAVGVTALSLEPLEDIGLADAGDLTRGVPGWLLSRTDGFHQRLS